MDHPYHSLLERLDRLASVFDIDTVTVREAAELIRKLRYSPNLLDVPDNIDTAYLRRGGIAIGWRYWLPHDAQTDQPEFKCAPHKYPSEWYWTSNN